VLQHPKKPGDRFMDKNKKMAIEAFVPEPVYTDQMKYLPLTSVKDLYGQNSSIR